MDLKLPGMLNAAMTDCPIFGGKVKSFDEAAAMKMPGVKRSFVSVTPASRWSLTPGGGQDGARR